MNTRAWRPVVVTHGHNLVTVERERDFRDCEADENYRRTKEMARREGFEPPTLRFEA